MLCLENVCLGYHNRRSGDFDQDIIKSVSFKIPDGEFLAVIGPNGSGKSTLLRALAGAMVPRTGQVLLDKRPVHKYAPRVLAKELAFLPQGPCAPEDYTVRDLVGYGRFPHLGWSGRMTRKDRDIVDQAVERTHLEALADRPVASLSGGERQRSWIAMALAQQARVLILDEPTTFLDICFQLEVLELIKNLNETLGITTVIVLHDLNQAARFARTILAIHQGRVAVAGSPARVFEKNTLETIFHISAGIKQDPHNHCPYLIPISSTKSTSLKTGAGPFAPRLF